MVDNKNETGRTMQDNECSFCEIMEQKNRELEFMVRGIAAEIAQRHLAILKQVGIAEVPADVMLGLIDEIANAFGPDSMPIEVAVRHHMALMAVLQIKDVKEKVQDEIMREMLKDEPIH